MSPSVLFVYRRPLSFILQDRDLLAKHAEVHEFRWSSQRHPARALARWMLRHRRAFDVVLVWFGDTHASVATRVARLLGKPSIIIVGGYDISDVPEYGFLSTSRGVRYARGHFGRATRIVVVCAALRNTLVARFPCAANKCAVLHSAVDTDRFRPGGSPGRQVLCVAAVDSWPRALIKGLDRVAAVAASLPEIPFRLVGPSPEVARQLGPPPNLAVTGPISQDDLIPLYGSGFVYLQPSRSEGSPNALLEAMASGCVPVVTREGGMPEIVGDIGFVVGDETPDLTEAVRKALDVPAWGAAARARVVEGFSLRGREEGLRRVVDDVLRR